MGNELGAENRASEVKAGYHFMPRAAAPSSGGD